jgi:hypothetical protein
MAVLRPRLTQLRNACPLKDDDSPADVFPVGHWLDALAKASTGHRARHRTARSGAESPPESGRPVAISPAPEAQGLTRRALLRRGAVVGAVVWTTPILQTALAPAAAASGLCGTNCLCPFGTECDPGYVCVLGVCLVDGGGSGCGSNADCASGVCNLTTSTCLGWPGATCSTGTQCASGKCTGGQCFANGVGGSCRDLNDCTDNTTCGPTKVCGGLGATCANNNQCVSNKCQGGICVNP